MTNLITLEASSAGDPPMRVHRAEVAERMSAPARLDLTLTTARLDLAEVIDELLGEQVVVRFHAAHGGVGERQVHGDVTQASALDSLIDRRCALQLRIETLDWRLRRRINSRVFQELTTPEILAIVLSEHAIEHVFQLREPCAVREYCVQYQESDEAFVRRLLGDAGLLYFHIPAPEGSATSARLVITDTSDHYLGHDGPLLLHPRGEADDSALDPGVGSALFELRTQKSARPERVVARRYDEARPQASFESTARAQALARLKVERQNLQSVATGNALPQPEVEPNTLYLHRTRPLSPDDRAHDAGTLLEQHRRDVFIAAGRGNADAMVPGRVVRVADHTIAALNGDYVVTMVKHRYELGGGAAAVYENRFECVPSTVAFRCPPAEPRRISAVETATVMGPPGTQVHTDKLGRVKVRFHWERSTRDSDRSCWVRAIQPWAGSGWGAMFLPRVGTEVAIGFLGGDVDRPVILGGLYNGASFPPVDLPREALRSGFRSASVDPSTGELAGGSSHILFSDEANHEVVSLRAQRDFHEEIIATSTTQIGADRSAAVHGNDLLQVGKQRTVFVTGDTTDDTAGNHVQRIGGLSEIEVAGPRSEHYKGSVFRSAPGVMEVSSTFHAIRADRDITLSAGGPEGGGNGSISVNGQLSLYSSSSNLLTSDTEIALSVGDSRIEITPDRIRLVAKEIEVAAHSSTVVQGGGAGVALAGGVNVAGGEVRLLSSGASLVLDANASLDGALVRLNCGGASGGVGGIESANEETKKVRLQLSRNNRLPMSGWKYLLLASGVRLEGLANPIGIVEVEVPVAVTRATLYVQNPDDAEDHFTWNLQIGPIAPLTTIKGVRARLRNLGFYAGGAASDEVALEDDPRLVDAVVSFQRAHHIEPTGTLNEPTMLALESYES